MRRQIIALMILVYCLITSCNDNSTAQNENALKKIGTEAAFKQQLSKAILQRNNLAILNDVASMQATAEFSRTTLIERGVDENDFVKYDGEYLFALLPAGWGYTDSSVSSAEKLRIFKTTGENPAVELVQEIDLESEGHPVTQGMYLLPQSSEHPYRRILLVRNYYARDFTIQESEPDYGWTYAANSEILIYRQVSQGHFVESSRLSLSGFYQDSRIINNRLVITHFGAPYLTGEFPSTGEHLELILAETPVDRLLPRISVNTSQSRPAFAAEDCYIPNISSSEYFAPRLLYFASISLNNIENTKFLCIFSEQGAFYASPQSIFVTSEHEEHTGVHYVDLDQSQLHYRGSAQVPGSVGPNAHFRLSEYNGAVRVVSSWRNVTAGDLKHQLSIFSLRDIQNGILQEVAHLPNAERPEPIGKPGEDIYAVRFLEDKAFIVTFERIDPFYVLDLAQPKDPYIAGALEIPGFSTLLQPINANLILGIGRLENQLKLEVFDVSNIKAPVSKDIYLLDRPGAYSETEWNHHALTLLPVQNGNAVRLALPLSFYHIANEPLQIQIAYEDPKSSLALFNLNAGNGDLEFQGEIIANSENQTGSFFYHHYARSVLHSDHVYFLANGRLWSSYWQNPSSTWENGL